jgi:hypothetical protein
LEDRQFRKAEQLEQRNREGKNSGIAQGGQAVVDVVTGDTDTSVVEKAKYSFQHCAQQIAP